MTEKEKQSIVEAVLSAVRTNSRTIVQLTPVTSLANSDSLEVSGGKKITFLKLKELIASSVVVTEESIKSWVVIESTDDLPEEPTPEEQMKAYVLADESTLYVYVGEGGDTLDGSYKSVNMKGAKGDSGVDLGEVVLVNDLTTGGEENALTAEMGKMLNLRILTNASGIGYLQSAMSGKADLEGGVLKSAQFPTAILDARVSPLDSLGDEEDVVFTQGNTYINVDGTEEIDKYQHNSTHSLSGYIEIANVERLVATLKHTDAQVVWYDSTKAFVSCTTKQTIITDVDIMPQKPAGAYYVRLCTFNENRSIPFTPSATIYYKKGRVTILEESVNDLEDNVSDLEDSVTSMLEDTQSLALTEKGYYWMNGTIIAPTTSSNHYHTPLTPIEGRRWLRYFTVMGTGGCAVAFFTANKEFIASLAIEGNNSRRQVFGIIDLSDDKYVNAAYVSVSFYNTALDDYKYYRAELRNSFGSPFPRPLDVLIFGDSITDYANISVSGSGSTPIETGGKTTEYHNLFNGFSYTDDQGNTIVCNRWPFLMLDALPIRDLRNYALSGASYKTKGRQGASTERQNLQAQITLAIADYDSPNSGVFPYADFEPDIVIFALGTNDGAPNDTPQEAMAVTGSSASAIINALDDTYFCQSARKAFLRVRQKWPKAQMFCELPIQRADREQLTNGCNEYLREMANRYGMAVIDAGSESGVVREFEKTNENGYLLKDGLHPNKAGQSLLARCIISSICTRFELVFEAARGGTWMGNGGSSADLSNYYTKQQVNALVSPKADKAMLVGVSASGSGWVADKSAADIAAAVAAGREVVVVHDSLRYRYVANLGSAHMFQGFDSNLGLVTWLIGDSVARAVTNVQEALVSGESIKTINNTSMLGSGNLALATREALDNFCPIIEDTRTSAVANITGVAPFDTLVDGQRIILKFAYSNAAQPTLTLTLTNNTTTNAIPLYFRGYGGFKRPANGLYIAGCYIYLIYDSTNAKWVVTNTDYDFSVSTITQELINEGTSTIARAVTPKLLCDNFNKVTTLVEVSTTGDVSQALDSGKFYRFGEVDSLTLTLNAASVGMAGYFGKFTTSASWTALSVPSGVTSSSGSDTIAASKTYEFNIIDNVILVKEV